MSGFLLCAAAGALVTLFVSDNVIGASPGRYELAKIYTFIADYAGVSADHSSFRNLARFEPGFDQFCRLTFYCMAVPKD